MPQAVETVFILGAGASKAAGVPLMAEFLGVARDLERIGNVGAHAGDFRLVFDAVGAMQQIHSKSRMETRNIENVFAAFEFATIIGTFCGYSKEEFEKLPAAMCGVIAETIERTMRFPLDDSGCLSSPVPYGDFARLVRDLHRQLPVRHRVTILTFNYDLALDASFHLEDVPMTYFDDDPNLVALLKLHGSLNWAKCDQCKTVAPWMVGDYLKTKSWIAGRSRFTSLSTAGQLNQFKHHGQHDVTRDPVLVPPTWNKSPYHAVISNVWHLAAKRLSTADNLIVIGYSMPETDTFFRHLYALGTVGAKMLDRFWVIDPSLEVRERFTELLGPGAEQAFKFYQSTFEQAIPLLEGSFRSSVA